VVILFTHFLEGSFTPLVLFAGKELCTVNSERAFFQIMSIEVETQKLSKLLYSVSEAAALLSCSRNTVYALIKSGKLLAVHPTSSTRISAVALTRFVQIKEDEARLEREAQRRVAG
jgi:excisionase family DNA binding protein